jgi:integrase/DNA-directed RNA polymerase subunit RPC12/RpoP
LELEAPAAQPPISCPECGSERIWKDGLRKTVSMTVQRWICRNCGHRFSEPSLRDKNVDDLTRDHRVCISQTKAMKNLVTVETRMEPGLREATQDAKGKIVEYAFWLQKEGYSEATILGRSKLLKILVKRGANLYDPESIKKVIVKQAWCEGRKANAVDAYSSFLRMAGGTWEPPRYKGIRKIPFIPLETELDQLIAGCSRRMGTFLQFLKETGARAGEAWSVKWSDIDIVSKVVRITAEKHSNPRIFHISQKLALMVENLPRIYGDRVFSTLTQPLDHHRDHFNQQRTRIAYKLKNPRLLRITFHTFRHWKGTWEYHKTKDIYHVMQVLGHRNIQNTFTYVQLAEELFKDQQEYISKVAKTESDACALVDAGFEFVCDFNGNKIFKKPKY